MATKKAGYLYVAFGKKYVTELKTAIAGLRKVSQAPVAVMTDLPDDIQFDGVDHIIPKTPIYSYGSKIYCLLESPFEKTIFLDTDTYLCASIDGIFDLLDVFDVAAAHSNVHFSWDFINKNNPSYQPQYSDLIEYNTGVVAIHRERGRQFLENWKRIYESLNIKTDQCAFRDALIETQVKMATLPFEYNFMGLNSYMTANDKIRVLHGRFNIKMNSRRANVASPEYMAKLSKRVNLIKTKRFFISQHFRPISSSMNLLNLLRKIQKVLGVKVKSKKDSF